MLIVDFFRNLVSYFYVRQLSPLSKIEICDKLRNYLKPFDLRLSDTGIFLPEISTRMFLIYTKYVHGKYFLEGIPYTSIVYIKQEPDCLLIFLKDGAIFCLYNDNRIGVYSFMGNARFRRWKFFFQLRIARLKKQMIFFKHRSKKPPSDTYCH